MWGPLFSILSFSSGGPNMDGPFPNIGSIQSIAYSYPIWWLETEQITIKMVHIFQKNPIVRDRLTGKAFGIHS